MGELNNDNLTALYQTASRKYNLGTYDEFAQKMTNPENRKALYDQISNNIELGSFADFENRLVKKKESSVSIGNGQESPQASESGFRTVASPADYTNGNQPAIGQEDVSIPTFDMNPIQLPEEPKPLPEPNILDRLPKQKIALSESDKANNVQTPENLQNIHNLQYWIDLAGTQHISDPQSLEEAEKDNKVLLSPFKVENSTDYELMNSMSHSLILSGMEYLTSLTGSTISHFRDNKNDNIFSTALKNYQKIKRDEASSLSDYKPNLLEETISSLISLGIDSPLFKLGGLLGKATGGTLVKSGDYVFNSLLKKGAKEAVANDLVTNGFKKIIPKLIASSSTSSGALGTYDFLNNTVNQLNNGATFQDINWAQSLKEGGAGSVLGGTLGLLGFGANTLEKSISNNIENKVAQNIAKYGLKTVELGGENAIFTYGDASLRQHKKFNEITMSDFLRNFPFLIAQKVTHELLGGIKSESFTKDKADQGIYKVDMTSDDLNHLSKSVGRDITKVTDLSDANLEKITQDKNVPIITKQKALWALEGLRPNVDKVPTDLSIDIENGKPVLNIKNKYGESILKSNYEDFSDANKDAIKVSERINEELNRQKAASLKPDEVNDISSIADEAGINLEDFKKAADKDVSQRTAEDKKTIAQVDRKIRDYTIQKFRQKTDAEQLVDFKLKPETFETLDNIDRNVPVINDKLKAASNDLYNEYKRLEKSRDSQTRTNTDQEIQDAMNFLGNKITNLEDQRRIQGDTGKFFNLRSRGNEQTKTPPTEIKVGDMTLTGEDAQAYQDLVDKYGKDRADYMMGITEPKYNQETAIDTQAKQANQNIAENQKQQIEQTKPETQAIQETTQPIEQKLVENQPSETTQPENKPTEQINQGGQENATEKGKIPENNQQQYQRVAQGKNIPENTSQIRKSKSGQTGNSNSNERSGQVTQENIPEKTGQKTLTLENAKSVNELQQLLSERKIKYNDPEYLKKLQIARKNNWIDPEDVKQENDLKKVIENDSAKNKTPEIAGSSGKTDRTIKENVTSGPKDKINFKKYFTKERGLPKSVFSEKVKKEGAIKGLLYRANLIAKDALQAAKDAYKTKKLSDQQAGLISDVLENMGIEPKQRQEWLNKLPESLRPHIENMRDMIDKLTGEIQKTGILSPDNEMKFDQNTGFYLTRSYRKFRDPNYNWNNISDEVKVAAGKALKQYYPDASNDKILGILKNIVEDKSFGSFIAGEQPLGKMNLGITKNRSVFLTDNPEIRNLMGEIRDPFVNFAISTAKMTELEERAKFLNNVTDIGLREGWLKPDIEGEFRTPIGVNKIIGFDFNGPKFSKSGKSLSPLNEYYTTPEIADAFKSFNDGPRITNWFIRLYMRGVTETKLANTAFSIGSQARNFQSNGMNLIANAAWNVHDIIPEFKKLAKSKESWRNFMQELKTNSIVGDNVETQAMLKDMEQLSGYMDRIYNEESPIKKGITNSRRFFLNMYSLGDDVFKAYRYVSEYTRYQKVYEKRGMTPEDALNEAKQTAKKILHDTQTYYSNIPAFMDYLRVLPFSGTFIIFPYLTTVNVKNTAVLAAKEMASPDTFKIGLQRGSGLIAGLSGLAILAWMRNRSQGLDSQDMGKIRKALPSYWKNDIITIKKVLGNGKFIYSNTSYLDFYNSVTTPILSIIHAYGNKGKLTSQDFINSIQEFLSPYADNEILAQRIMNMIQNYDKDTKQPIYNEALPVEQQNLEKIKYLFGAIVPATIKDIDRTIKIAKRDGDWKSFAIGRATGRQTRELDLGRSFSKYMVPIYKDHLDNAVKIYRDLYYDKTKSSQEKEKGRKTASEQLNKYVQELHDSYNSFKMEGASAEEMNKALSFGYGGFPMKKILRMAIIDGSEVEIDQDGNIMFKKK